MHPSPRQTTAGPLPTFPHPILHICIYIYTHTHTHTHKHTHTHTHTHTHMHTYIRTHTCIHTYTHTQHAYIKTYVHSINTDIQTHTCMDAWMHTTVYNADRSWWSSSVPAFSRCIHTLAYAQRIHREGKTCKKRPPGEHFLRFSPSPPKGGAVPCRRDALLLQPSSMVRPPARH